MADEDVQATEGAAEDDAPKKKLNLKALILIGGVVIVQVILVAVVLMIGKGMSGSKPQDAEAADTAAAAPVDPELVEVSIHPDDPDYKIRTINAKSGQVVYWMLKVHLRVPLEQKEKVEERLKANTNTVIQSIYETVGESEPYLLKSEANHATLKRQIRHKLNKVLGKGLIEDVVISECIPTMP